MRVASQVTHAASSKYRSIQARKICDNPSGEGPHRKVTPDRKIYLDEEEIMKLFRRLTIALLALALCLSLVVISTTAQPGRARWEGNNGRHRGWSSGRHRGWSNRGRRIGWNDDYYSGYRRLSWRERRRLARMRMYNRRNAYYGNSYYDSWERRRARYRANRYRNSLYFRTW